jgi:hypothetical protein
VTTEEIAQIIKRVLFDLCSETGKSRFSGGTIYKALSKHLNAVSEGEMATSLYLLASQEMIYVKKYFVYSKMQVTVPDCSRLRA